MYQYLHDCIVVWIHDTLYNNREGIVEESIWKRHRIASDGGAYNIQGSLSWKRFKWKEGLDEISLVFKQKFNYQEFTDGKSKSLFNLDHSSMHLLVFLIWPINHSVTNTMLFSLASFFCCKSVVQTSDPIKYAHVNVFSWQEFEL